MQLLRYTDYALRALLYVGAHPGRPVPAATIAKAYGISVDHVSKATKALTRARLLSARRGGGGGVELARPASQIQIGTVVRLFERGRGSVECLREGGVAGSRRRAACATPSFERKRRSWPSSTVTRWPRCWRTPRASSASCASKHPADQRRRERLLFCDCGCSTSRSSRIPVPVALDPRAELRASAGVCAFPAGPRFTRLNPTKLQRPLGAARPPSWHRAQPVVEHDWRGIFEGPVGGAPTNQRRSGGRGASG